MGRDRGGLATNCAQSVNQPRAEPRVKMEAGDIRGKDLVVDVGVCGAACPYGRRRHRGLVGRSCLVRLVGGVEGLVEAAGAASEGKARKLRQRLRLCREARLRARARTRARVGRREDRHVRALPGGDAPRRIRVAMVACEGAGSCPWGCPRV